MSVAFSALYPELQMYAPGAPEPTMDFALRRAADTFCRDSMIWRFTGDVNNTEIGEPYMDMEAPTGAIAFLPVAVSVGSRPTDPTSIEDVKSSYGWESRTGTPTTYFADAEGSIRLFPIPDVVLPVQVTAAVTVNATTKTLDDIIGVRHRDTLIAGALSRLLMIPNQPFSAPELGAMYANLFHAGVAKARIGGAQNLTRAPLRVTLNSF